MDGNLPIKRGRESNNNNNEDQDWNSRKRGKFINSQGGSPERSVTASGCVNPFKSLSPELLDYILQYLPRTDLVSRVVLVDTHFYTVTQGDKGAFMHKGREAYAGNDFIEAARYFVNISQPQEDVESMDIDEDISHVKNAKDGLVKCLAQMRFLDLPELNQLTDEELLVMSHDDLCALWKDHVEVKMASLSGKNKKDLEMDVYNWSHKAATGSWGDAVIDAQERVYCCERLIFLLRYSSNDDVRKDAMLALMRIAREMQGVSDFEKELVRQSVGKVVHFIRQTGGLKAVGGIAKIVFESLQRSDASFIAKEALLRALGASLNPVRDELRGLLAERARLKRESDEALMNSVEVSELNKINAQLETHASLIAEIDRLKGERRELTVGLFAAKVGEMNKDNVNNRLTEVHARLGTLREVSQEVSNLKERRMTLQARVFGGLADETEEQELSVIDKRLSDLKVQRDEISSLRNEVQQLKSILQVLKIDFELNKLRDSIDRVEALRERKSNLEKSINALEVVQDLNQVDARIATLDAFVQGFIKQVSIDLAQAKLSPDDLQDEALRRMLVDELCMLCLAHPQNEKTFNQLEELLGYMIQRNVHVSDSECLDFKERLLELEKAHPSPARAQRVNVWLFRIGNSELDFPGDISVADDAMNTWLDRITEESEKLIEPFPPARIGRLATALGSPSIKTESRLRIFNILRPHLSSVAKGDVQDAEALHILQSFSSSVTSFLKELATKETEFDLQQELYDFTGQLVSLVPKDWAAARAILNSVDSEISDLVRTALRAEVLDSNSG